MKIFYEILFILGSYVIGSIPFAYIFTKLIKNVDLSKVGSRNIGATNASRVLGKKWFFIIMVLDGVKGLIPVLISRAVFPEPAGLMPVLTGLGCILGHSFSLFLGFKGGKGAAVSTGVLLALSYKIVIPPVILFILLVLITRYISLGSIALALALPVTVLVLEPGSTALFVFTLLIACYVTFKHKDNIQRLLSGTERKWGEKIK
ncbi:MAG: glycerol-3-phosphate 1-O-acyltransferase PlsY [bacterium]|nr:glycerol-3-phosphate 1-O-acyltransferase PlsY [bacterium]